MFDVDHSELGGGITDPSAEAIDQDAVGFPAAHISVRRMDRWKRPSNVRSLALHDCGSLMIPVGQSDNRVLCCRYFSTPSRQDST